MPETTEIIRISDPAAEASEIERAGQILREGGLVAFPTETVYGLGGNALLPESSRRIYAAKGRPSDNPLIVHIAETEELFSLAAEVPQPALTLAEAFWPGPMTLILKKSRAVPGQTTGGLDTVAIRLPSHPVARALIKAAGVPIAAPSANSSGRPSPTTAEHVIEDLFGKIDMIIDGGESDIGLESTIIDLTGEKPELLRPGFISEQAVTEVIGSVEKDPSILASPAEGTAPRAPGMKYRHYAPAADMYLISGEKEKVREKIRLLVSEAGSRGEKPAVICASQDAGCFEGAAVFSVGSAEDEREIAHRLFSVLRETDKTGVDIIFAEMLGGEQLDLAIKNRMLKAAGYKVIEV